MTPETEIYPLILTPVTAAAFTLTEGSVLHRPQQSRLIPAVRIMTAETGQFFRITVKMGFIEGGSGLMTGETETGSILT